MNLQTFAKTAPVSLTLIVLFIGYFALQAALGVNIDNPSGSELIRFGANVLPLSLGDEPWRLLSSGFLHIGLMHLMFNSFAMYFFGQAAESVFGTWRFLGLFLLAVVSGNLLSNYMTWQAVQAGSHLNIGAGASGGIMGVGTSLLVLSFFPKYAQFLNKTSLLWVMAINLVIGFAIPNIDNAAHIGGTICGAIMAVALGLKYLSSPIKAIIFYLSITTMLVLAWLAFHQAIRPLL